MTQEFKKSKECQLIGELIERNCMLDSVCKFVVYSDLALTYEYKFENFMIETSVIADDDMAYEETFEDLLNLKRISFFWVRLFINEIVVQEIMWNAININHENN